MSAANAGLNIQRVGVTTLRARVLTLDRRDLVGVRQLRRVGTRGVQSFQPVVEEDGGDNRKDDDHGDESKKEADDQAGKNVRPVSLLDCPQVAPHMPDAVSYTHLRAHETVLDLV